MQYQTDFKTLVTTLAAQEKLDFLASPSQIKLSQNKLNFSLSNQVNSFPVADTGHEAISRVTNIPMKYYKKMKTEEPELLENNVNTWFGKDTSRKMIRVLDGECRALLSDRYQRIDNLEIAQAAITVFNSFKDKNLQFIDCGISPNFMRVKVLFPIKKEVDVGDVVQAGIVITNSEIGKSSARVEGLTYRLICNNGAISSTRVRKYHVGAQYDQSDKYLTERTKIASDAAAIMQLRDTISGMLNDPTWFEEEIAKMQGAKKEPILRNIEELPQRVNTVLNFTDDEISKMLVGIGQQMSTVEEDIPSRYDLANAITWTAQRVDNYDRRMELETVGGQIISDNGLWRKLR